MPRNMSTDDVLLASSQWSSTSRHHSRAWLAAQGEWPTNQDEYALAHFSILAFFVALTALLDNGARQIQRSLEPEDRRLSRSEFRRELGLIVWMRLQGELMVVGSLVVWIWLAHETGLLEGLAAFSVNWQLEHPSVDDNPISDPLANPTRFAKWLEWALSCHPRGPRDATTLLHVLQDVLVSLFVAKVLYFLFLLLALRTQTDWLTTYERLESGGAPRNPAEHFSWRQIDAMREQLLQVLSSEPTLREKIERSADLKASVDRGSLYVSGFLAETIHAHMAILAEFSNNTWLLILLYVCSTSTSLFMCVEYRHLTLALDVLWYGSSAYLCYRLLLHAATLRQTAREQEQQHAGRRSQRASGKPSRTGWPAEWVDWLLFPFVGPGVTGFVPCRPRPSELVGMRCLQAMLWVHFYRLGEYLTDPFRRHEHVSHVLMEALVNLAPKLLFLLLWALYVVPGMLEVFSLPPFLSDLEHSLLLHTLSTYPNGLPADGLLVQPGNRSGRGSPAPKAEGGGGAPNNGRAPPSTPHAVSQYVLLKAQRREESNLVYWRTVKSWWRGVIGLPPLRDTGQRLVAHYEWIHTEDGVDDANGAAANGAANGAASGAASGGGALTQTLCGSVNGMRPSTPVQFQERVGARTPRGASPELGLL